MTSSITPPVIATSNKRRFTLITCLVGAVSIACAALAAYVFRIPQVYHPQNTIKLAQPDVWVHSQNVSLLPRDLLQVPFLKSLLTEDFVYFYAQDEDWLSLQGAMRRISFEHDLNWSDELLKNIADAPADIYMWHDDSHALRYWALSLARDPFTTIAQKLLTLKFTVDKQVLEIARISIDGNTVPVLQVSLSPRRQMVLAAHNNRMVLLSDIAMASNAGEGLDKQAETLLKRLLSGNDAERAQVVSEWQVPDKANPVTHAQQTILLSNRLFAQGYAAFAPNIRALRFDYDGKAWQTQANRLPSAFDPKIWTYLPANAAFCVSTPVDWPQVQKALDGDSLFSAKPNLAAEFAPTGAACWYAEQGNTITEPLFVGLRQPSKNSGEALTALFDWGVASNQDHLKDLLLLNRQKHNLTFQLATAEDSLGQVQQEKIDPKAGQQAEAQVELEARKATAKAAVVAAENALEEIGPQISAALAASKAPALLAKEKMMTTDGEFTVLSRKLPIDTGSGNSPRLAFDQQVVYFSTNQALVKRAVSVGQRKYPNLQESSEALNATAQQLLWVNPEKLATLLTNTGHEALPQATQPRLRAAFDYHMPARLQALAKQPSFSLELDNAHNADPWQALTWHVVP